MTMYRNSNSVIRGNNTVGAKFNVKVRVHQGSVLSLSFIIIVFEAIFGKYRITLPLEMLYADDLVMIAESLEELDTWYAEWKHCIEGKGLRGTWLRLR